jgi:hypothetical protein
MKRPKIPPAIGPDDWLRHAASPEVASALHTDAYSAVYPTLVQYFESFPRPLKFDSAVVGLHIVYGWMPRIPDLGLAASVGKTRAARASLEGKLSDSLGPNAQRDAGTIMETVRRFTNNSLVGASKFLHFLRPDVFPIWDSRVARRFLPTLGRPTPAKMHNLGLWQIYFDAVNAWKLRPDVAAKIAALRGLNPNLASVTDIRIIELALFHPKPRKEARDE